MTGGSTVHAIPPLDLAAGWRERAERAAAAAGVTVAPLERVVDLVALDRVFAAAWGGQGQGAVPVNMMKALAHAGQYVAGVWREGQLIGGAVAFTHGPGGSALHSHIAGVDPRLQGAGAGYALKLDQAAWAAEAGLEAVTWTYDPLVRRNAWFNLVKLGARVVSYHPNFYGELVDGTNQGDETDRCFVSWDLRQATGSPPAAVLPEGAAVCLRAGDHEKPIVTAAEGGGPLAHQIPRDIVALRRADPGLGAAWRRALRSTMGGAIMDGYTVTSMTADGFYLLEMRDA